MKNLFFKSLAVIMLSSLLLCSCGEQEGVLTPAVPENQRYIEMYNTLIGTTWTMASEDEQTYYTGENKKELVWCFQTISFGTSEITVKLNVCKDNDSNTDVPFLNGSVPKSRDGETVRIPINTLTCVTAYSSYHPSIFVVYNNNTSKDDEYRQAIIINLSDLGNDKIKIICYGAWEGVDYKKVTSQSGSGSGGGSGGGTSCVGTYSFTKPEFKYNGSITLKNGTWTYDSNKEQVPAKNGTYSVSDNVITFTWTVQGNSYSSSVRVSIDNGKATLTKTSDNSAVTFFSSFFGETKDSLTFTYNSSN